MPPNDPSGAVFTTNSNDAYSGGRGIVFQMSADTVIDSVGLFQNLTNITLNYEVAQVLTVSGQVDSVKTVLRSGSGTFTTSGLEFIDFGFPALTLQAGNAYHIEFSFNGSANQNFFYDNANVSWTQGAFTSLDGTEDGNTSNFVVPAIRVNAVEAVPAPSGLLLAATGFPLLVRYLSRRKSRSAEPGPTAVREVSNEW